MILVADDSPTLSEMIALTLRSVGYQVILAGDGLQALAAMRINQVELIVTDVNMPNMDGEALVKAIRAGSSNPDIPILALSSRAGAFEHRMRAAGADKIMMKPFDRVALIEAIERLLTARGADETGR